MQPETAQKRTGLGPLRLGGLVLFAIMAVASLFMLYAEVVGLKHGATLHGPFNHDAGSRLIITPVPDDNPLKCCTSVRGDTSENGNASKLRLWINDKEITPAHSLHETIRQGGPGFSHWGNAVYFPLPEGSNGPEALDVRVEYPLEFSSLLTLAIVGPTLLLAGWLFGPWLLRTAASGVTSINSGKSGRRVAIGALAVLGLVSVALLALEFGLVKQSQDIRGPFLPDPAGGVSQLVTVPISPTGLAACCGGVRTDSSNTPIGSSLSASLNGKSLGAPHAAHADIRKGAAGYSHWQNALWFALPAGAANDASSTLTVTYSVVPPGGVTMIAVLLTLLLAATLYGRPARAWLMTGRAEELTQRAAAVSMPDATRRNYVLGKWLIAGALLVFFLIAAWLLREPDLEFYFEADFAPQRIAMWRHFFSTWNVADLDHPGTGYLYLDGEFITYALLANTLKALTGIIPALAPVFPNEDSFNLGGDVFANIVAYALAGSIFYLAMVRLMGGILLPVLLAVAFFFAPQMIAIGIVRVDYLIVLPLMAVFYCSIAIAQGNERWWHAVVLGLGMGYISALKINGPFYGLLPAFAVIGALIKARSLDIRRHVRFTLLALVLFAVTYGVLMARFFIKMSVIDIAMYYRETMGEIDQWRGASNAPQLMYYNIELMLGHGWPFVVSYMLCGAVALWLAIAYSNGVAILLSLSFITFSIFGELTFKYNRGGYHLLPIFFACIALAVAALQKGPAKPYFKWAGAGLAAAILASSVVFSADTYLRRTTELSYRPAAVQALKREPRQWLVAHLKPKSRICILRHSNWTVPQMNDLDVTLTYGPLDIPYLDPVAITKYEPPSMETVRDQCDVVVLSDWHINELTRSQEKYAPAVAARWQAFYAALPKTFPQEVFQSEHDIMSLKRIEVYDMHATVPVAPAVVEQQAPTTLLTPPAQ